MDHPPLLRHGKQWKKLTAAYALKDASLISKDLSFLPLRTQQDIFSDYGTEIPGAG